MKRLKLNVEEIEVESFAATGAEGGMRGTVQAHAKATYGCTEGWAGCEYSAAETCPYTCDGGASGCGYESQCVGWCESQHDSCSCLTGCPLYVTNCSPGCN